MLYNVMAVVPFMRVSCFGSGAYTSATSFSLRKLPVIMPGGYMPAGFFTRFQPCFGRLKSFPLLFKPFWYNFPANTKYAI